jgi:lysophospholipase L1-like esterase
MAWAIAGFTAILKLAGQLLDSSEAIRISMREKLIKVIISSRAISYGSLVLLTFIVAMKNPLHDRTHAANKPYTYLALGDSYTIGEKVDPKQNFPNQVTSLLKEQGYDFSQPRIIAQTGWTTNELEEAIKKAKITHPFDFVTLLIGVNNQYRGGKAGDYAPEFESLLTKAVEFAGNDTNHVFILSIPDWGVTPFAKDRNTAQISKEIDEYNEANSTIASKYKVHYIDITPSTREAGKNPALLASDGLHPSAKEYAKWAREIAELIKTKL